MNKQRDQLLDDARAKLASMEAQLIEVMKNIQDWFQADGRVRSNELGVIEMQAYNLRNEFKAFTQRTLELGAPFYGRRVGTEDFSFITTIPTIDSIVEVDEAYDHKKLDRLN